MAMRYVLGNYIDSTTLSSVSTENTPAFGKVNMYNRIQSLPWRMTAKSGHAIFDMGSNVPTVLGIMNHNLVGTGAYSLTLKTAASEGALVAADAENITFHAQNIWHVITSTPLQWWRIDVSDPDNGANLEFGETILHIWAAFTRNYLYPYKEGLDYVVDENVTHYGRRHRAKRAKRKLFNLDFEGVQDALLISEIEAFFEGLDGDRPFIFIPNGALTDSWYVECLNSMEATRIFLNYNKFSLKLEEQSRGITLL